MERKKESKPQESPIKVSGMIKGDDLLLKAKTPYIEEKEDARQINVQSDEYKIEELHKINLEIYTLIKRLKELGASHAILFQNLKDATVNIQRVISTYIDNIVSRKDNEENESPSGQNTTGTV